MLIAIVAMLCFAVAGLLLLIGRLERAHEVTRRSLRELSRIVDEDQRERDPLGLEQWRRVDGEGDGG